MPSDAAFYVVAAFPLVSVAGFGAAYLLLSVVYRSGAGDAFGRSTMWIHLLLLTIPLGAAWRDGLLRGEPADLGLRFPDVGGLDPALSSVVAVPVAAATGVVLYCGELVATATHRRRDTSGIAPMPPCRPALLAHVAPAAAIVIAEEYIWRGYLTLYLSERAGLHIAAALVATSGMFGLHHAAFGLRSCLAKMIHGLVWGLMLVSTGSLLPSIVSHAAFQCMVWRRMRRVPGCRGTHS